MKLLLVFLLLFASLAYATHYNQQYAYSISSPAFTTPVKTIYSAPTPIRIALRRPSTFYSAAQQTAFPQPERDVYEGYSQPPFPERFGEVGVRWERGALVPDEYEGFRQTPFQQAITWPLPREEYEGFRQPAFFQTPLDFIQATTRSYSLAFPEATQATYAPTAYSATVFTPVPTASPPRVREITVRITHAGGFSPSAISVNQGDAVRIRASTDFPGHMHGLVISAYGINRRVSSTSSSTPEVIEFIANAAGSFTITCGCGSEHFALGGSEFTGMLVVS